MELVKRAIETAECGELDKALNFFDKAIAKAPDCPSILNDRAQALRLAGRVDGIYLHLFGTNTVEPRYKT